MDLLTRLETDLLAQVESLPVHHKLRQPARTVYHLFHMFLVLCHELLEKYCGIDSTRVWSALA